MELISIKEMYKEITTDKSRNFARWYRNNIVNSAFFADIIIRGGEPYTTTETAHNILMCTEAGTIDKRIAYGFKLIALKNNPKNNYGKVTNLQCNNTGAITCNYTYSYGKCTCNTTINSLINHVQDSVKDSMVADIICTLITTGAKNYD